MPRGVHIVFTNCTDAGRHEEYNRWYSQTHLADLSAARGLVSARRFVNLRPHQAPAQYMALYEFQTADLAASVDNLRRIAGETFALGRHIDCLEKVPSLELYSEIDPAAYKPLEQVNYPRRPFPQADPPRPEPQRLAATLPRTVALVLSELTDPSRDEELNRWYTHTHQPDLSGAQGLLIAKRYRNERPELGPADYLAYYEFEGDDPWSCWEDLLRLAGPTFERRRIDCMENVGIYHFQEIDAGAYRPQERLDYPRTPSASIAGADSPCGARGPTEAPGAVPTTPRTPS